MRSFISYFGGKSLLAERIVSRFPEHTCYIPNPSFSINTVRRANLKLLRIEEELSAAHLRLSRVYIENLPYEAFIHRFDKNHTLFYIDPPYYNHETDYGKGIFKKEDFNNLAGILKEIKGKFVFSINDVKEIREMFGDFYIQKVNTTYTCAKTKKKKVTELLITNFKSKKV